jgi:superfamily I DNA/RNA helicase
MRTTRKTQRFYSLGCLSQIFQRSVQDIRAALTELRIRPATAIDGIEMFDENSFDLLLEYFDALRKRAGRIDFTKGKNMFQKLVNDRMRTTGETRRQATIAVAKSHPALHREFLQSTQSNSIAARLVGTRPAPAKTVTGKAAAFVDLVVDEMANSGCSRKVACRRIARRSPKLHAEFLKATNAATSGKLISAMFE